jgi:hypothetical protein
MCVRVCGRVDPHRNYCKQLTHTHTHTLSLSHTHTYTHTHTYLEWRVLEDEGEELGKGYAPCALAAPDCDAVEP